MKTLPRIALTLAPLLLRRGAAGPKRLKNNMMLWCLGGLSFIFLLISLIITVSVRISPSFAFLAIGLLFALTFMIIWIKNKRDMNQATSSSSQHGMRDAALLDQIPQEIRDNENFKSFVTLIEGHPYESILLSLFLGLVMGQQIRDNN